MLCPRHSSPSPLGPTHHTGKPHKVCLEGSEPWGRIKTVDYVERSGAYEEWGQYHEEIAETSAAYGR